VLLFCIAPWNARVDVFSPKEKKKEKREKEKKRKGEKEKKRKKQCHPEKKIQEKYNPKMFVLIIFSFLS